MRQFDHNGLMLAEYQGKLFERSNELDCSTAVFIRRFLHSDLLSKLDSNNSSSLSLDVYYSFHTQDPEWCIKSLLEINKLSENIFDNNARLKQIIREHGNY